MKLTLNIELEETDDANIFVGIQKFHNGKEVDFERVYGFPNDIVARSTLRVALRTVNENLSTPYTPEYDFDTLKPLSKGEKTKMEFKFSPSGTYYRNGDELRLVIQGRYFINSSKIHQPFDYHPSSKGKCIVHASNVNVLLMPVIPVKS